MNYPKIEGLSFSFSYAPPRDPPANGATWDTETDYPGVCVTVCIRRDSLYPLAAGKLFGQSLWPEQGWWGDLWWEDATRDSRKKKA